MRYAQLLTAAAVLIACGCTESSLEPSSNPGSVRFLPPTREMVEIIGTVGVSAGATFLHVESGGVVEIVGTEARRLAALSGALVQARGFWSDDDTGGPALQAEVFLVLAVGGRPAKDGLLGEDEGRYYLQISAGDLQWLDNGPSELADYIGKRIWVTGWAEDPPLTFGVIE